MSYVAADVLFMPPGEPPVRGRDALRTWMAAFLAQFRTSSLALADREVLVGNGWAVELGTFEDVIHRHDPAAELAWELGWTLPERLDVQAMREHYPQTVAAWAEQAPGTEVLACALLPLGVRFKEPLPAGVAIPALKPGTNTPVVSRFWREYSIR